MYLALAGLHVTKQFRISPQTVCPAECFLSYGGSIALSSYSHVLHCTNSIGKSFPAWVVWFPRWCDVNRKVWLSWISTSAIVMRPLLNDMYIFGRLHVVEHSYSLIFKTSYNYIWESNPSVWLNVLNSCIYIIFAHSWNIFKWLNCSVELNMWILHSQFKSRFGDNLRCMAGHCSILAVMYPYIIYKILISYGRAMWKVFFFCCCCCLR